jgi:hypothetical protein
MDVMDGRLPPRVQLNARMTRHLSARLVRVKIMERGASGSRRVQMSPWQNLNGKWHVVTWKSN